MFIHEIEPLFLIESTFWIVMYAYVLEFIYYVDCRILNVFVIN